MFNIETIALNNPWIPISKISELMCLSIKTLKEHCRNGQYTYRVEKNGRKSNYYINISSLPKYVKEKFQKGEPDSKKYSEAPVWAKSQADKYAQLIKLTKDLKGEELKKFVDDWNLKHIGKEKTSYSSIIKMRKRALKYGINGLLAQYGNSNKSSVNEEYFNYFKNLYLKEGGPSIQSCRDITMGYALKKYNIDKNTFPSYMAFSRKLKKEIPKQSIDLARKGFMYWNRNCGSYINRDYSCIDCGSVWVSDHAQIDVACQTEDGKVVFPWVTVWRDYKSAKWLGWILQTGSPNSDLIFQSFYYAALKYGLPKDVIIDNGKDYRSKDFAGGRTHFKIETNEKVSYSMLKELNVEANFALPYNAQTKPIERDFLKIKELLSKHCIGYRGGNVVERPECLLEEINNNKIMSFKKFKTVFDDFIVNILNKRPSKGKNHQGLSPDEVFNEGFREKIVVSKDALKLFCMRTSKDYKVGRNGIKDNALGITYWADWMIPNYNLKVYLRRDPSNFKEAWVFKSSNSEFIGTASAVEAVAALHADKISKEEFKTAMAIKKRNLKITKSYIKQTREIPIEEQCENYKLAYASVEKEYKPKISKISNTNMDKAIRKNKEMQEAKNIDLSELLVEEKEEEPFYLFETDKIIAEELKGVANGY